MGGDLAGQVAQGVRQAGVDLVSLLRLGPCRVNGSGLRTGLEVDEEPPVDRPVARYRTESSKIGRIVGMRRVVVLREEEGAARDPLVEPVLRADHGVPKTEGGCGELHRHQPEAVPELGKGGSGVVGVGEDALIRFIVDDHAKEVGHQ